MASSLQGGEVVRKKKMSVLDVAGIASLTGAVIIFYCSIHVPNYDGRAAAMGAHDGFNLCLHLTS